MLFWLSLIAGLILLLVSPPIFAAAHTVGVVLLVVAAVMFVFQVIALLAFNSARKRFTRQSRRR